MEASPRPESHPALDASAPEAEVLPLRTWEAPLSEEEEQRTKAYFELYKTRQDFLHAIPELGDLYGSDRLDLADEERLPDQVTLSRVLHDLAEYRLGESREMETVHPRSGTVVQLWRDGSHDEALHLSYAEVRETETADGRIFFAKQGFVETTDADGNRVFRIEERRRVLDNTSKAWDEQHSAVSDEVAEATPLDLASLLRVVMESRDFFRQE